MSDPAPDPQPPDADDVGTGSAMEEAPTAVAADAETQAAGAGGVGDRPSSTAAGSAHTTLSSVEDLVADLERITRERDEYLDALRRNQAEFENARKRMIKQQTENVDRAAEALVEKLLPVLDACDGAVRHGGEEVGPIFASLLGALEKEGLERIDPAGKPFDPTQHDAVMHEPADAENETAGTVVTDVMRAGYAWKGRILRAAMVKVRG